jgi:hypothetical protein
MPSELRLCELATTMNSGRLGKHFALGVLVCALCCAFSQLALAQGPIPDAPQPSVEAASFVAASAPEPPSQHKFWDKQSLALFTAAAAINMTDFAVTRANLQSGGRELNPIVRIFGRSTPGLAVNFVGETAGVIGVGYFLHKTGHHKLERIATTLDIGASAGAVTFGLTHR